MADQHILETKRKVSLLQNKMRDCVMLIGRAMADQVCASAELQQERIKLQTISLKTSILDRADATTQTGIEVDPERERRELLERRVRLLEDTRGMPSNSASMVDILKKRNAALLIREERALQRARRERQEKQHRLDQLRRETLT